MFRHQRPVFGEQPRDVLKEAVQLLVELRGQALVKLRLVASVQLGAVGKGH